MKTIKITFFVGIKAIINHIYSNEDTGRLEEIVINSEKVEVSDGYHTMEELYEHRLALNVALINTVTLFAKSYEDIGKSKLHHDGTMFEGGYFIVWINCNGKLVTYHYKLEHWDKFRCEEYPNAPEYDGHTSKDTIERLLSI